MRFATVTLTVCLLALTASQAAAGLPNFFSKGRPGSDQDPEQSWWKGKQPSFSLLDARPKQEPAAPTSNKPSVLEHVVYPFKQVGHGVQEVGHGAGRMLRKSTRWMIPHSKPAPVKATGSNSIWTHTSRAKTRPQTGGMSSWFHRDPEPPQTLSDWFKLKRMDP